jgi:hypothetical protein
MNHAADHAVSHRKPTGIAPDDVILDPAGNEISQNQKSVIAPEMGIMSALMKCPHGEIERILCITGESKLTVFRCAKCFAVFRSHLKVGAELLTCEIALLSGEAGERDFAPVVAFRAVSG